MLINNIGSSKNVYYYNEWYDDTGWNRRSEFPDPPASPAPNIGTNSNNNSPESPKSPPLKNITAHHKICFEVLQIPIIYNSREIKSAYKKLARKYHPDTYNIHKGISKKVSEEKFKAIANAYQDICLLKEIY